MPLPTASPKPASATGPFGPDRAVLFVGAGPGAPDLVTVRGLRALEAADLVLQAGSLVDPRLLAACRPDCRIEDSAGMDLEAQVALMAGAWREGKKIVRLHSGDPAIYGAIAEQMRRLAAQGVPFRVVPGVTSACAAAAALGVELTLPETSQSVVITRSRGRTPLPAGQEPARFARTGATLAFYLSAGHFRELAEELAGEGGLDPGTPAAAVSRATWEDERIVRGTLATIAQQAEEAGMGRQALLLVGRALAQGESGAAAPADAPRESRLYAAAFSHGYRNSLPEEAFAGRVAFHTFSRRGHELAKTLSAALGEGQGRILAPGHARADLEASWGAFGAHVFVGACGIAVRLVAPFLRDKAADPACLCVDEDGRFAVCLAGGHLAGGNRLARRLARVCGGQAVVSTGSDVAGIVAFDEAAAREGARILDTAAVLACNAALLDGRPVLFVGPQAVRERYWKDVPAVRPATPEEGRQAPVAVWWDVPLPDGLPKGKHLAVTGRAFALGCGCRRGVDPALLVGEALAFLARHGLEARQVGAVATIDIKAQEPALLALAGRLGAGPLRLYPARDLDAVPGVTHSPAVAGHTGTGSVCEAAALLAAGELAGATGGRGATLLAPKERAGQAMTFALARIPHGHGRKEGEDAAARPCAPGEFPSTTFAPGGGSLVVAGLGSGAPGSLTAEVEAAIRDCDVIAGYTTYVDHVRPLAAGKECIESGMRGEVERCTKALEAAAAGQRVCLVCSGDPGILAMAGLAYELKFREERFRHVPVKVLPGVTAASLAGAAVGAPFQNGLALVSLSDLLVSADEVRRNLRAVAASRLAVALYNPAGRRRRALLDEALAIFAGARGSGCPCGLVRHAGQAREERWTGLLRDLDRARVDMASLVIVGTDRTRLDDGVLYDPRGYAEKYLDRDGRGLAQAAGKPGSPA